MLQVKKSISSKLLLAIGNEVIAMETMESLIRQLHEIPGKIVMLHDGEYLFHEGNPVVLRKTWQYGTVLVKLPVKNEIVVIVELVEFFDVPVKHIVINRAFFFGDDEEIVN